MVPFCLISRKMIYTVKLIDEDLNFGCEECDMRINLESN